MIKPDCWQVKAVKRLYNVSTRWSIAKSLERLLNYGPSDARVIVCSIDNMSPPVINSG